MSDHDHRVDTSVPDPARRYNAMLGGKDNFAADRESAASLARALPSISHAAQENRRFLLRAVNYLAADCGVRQFLDIGVGLPIKPNVHEVAQAVDPTAHVVYVDHDPLVAAHARALLTSGPEGAVAFVAADLRQPDDILTDAALRDTLDLNQPIAVLLVAVLHFCDDTDDPYGAVHKFVAALPSCSYVALSHATLDPLTAEVRAQLQALAASDAGHGPFRPRTFDEVAAFLDGLTLVEPGLVSTVRWHPERQPAPTDNSEQRAICYGAVARVP